jgi:hypothetical protein
MIALKRFQIAVKAFNKISAERKTMTNIKITAEVNGEQVPLENISTETFEAIKALEKPKEISVARIAQNCCGERRLIFRVTNKMIRCAGQYIAVDLISGRVAGNWPGKSDDDGDCGDLYGYDYVNVKSL